MTTSTLCKPSPGNSCHSTAAGFISHLLNSSILLNLHSRGPLSSALLRTMHKPQPFLPYSLFRLKSERPYDSLILFEYTCWLSYCIWGHFQLFLDTWSWVQTWFRPAAETWCNMKSPPVFHPDPELFTLYICIPATCVLVKAYISVHIHTLRTAVAQEVWSEHCRFRADALGISKCPWAR